MTLGDPPTGEPSWRADERLPAELAACRRCPRLVAHREAVAREKRAAYRAETYWGAPVPGFGDPAARILLLGLAPGAHGSNRTGRQFTGDASSAFLYPALHRAGLASRPNSDRRGDGLDLFGTWITAAVRCVPPGNKPTRDEAATCQPWLDMDVRGLPNLRVVVAFGKFAHDAYLQLLRQRGARVVKARHPFEHAREHDLPAVYGGVEARTLLDGYHPSFQNTNTGVLTAAMLDAVLERAKVLGALTTPGARPG